MVELGPFLDSAPQIVPSAPIWIFEAAEAAASIISPGPEICQIRTQRTR